ncbi:MAG: hypothetical protein WAT19_11595 [Ferruginibacter sp.]
MLMHYQQIFALPNETKSGGIYTNKRWASYAEPSINHLIKVKIPIYMLVPSKDDNAPIEGAYIVPLEFARLGKKNLTFKVCIGCTHSLIVSKHNGDENNYWNYYFKDFIGWVEKQQTN